MSPPFPIPVTNFASSAAAPSIVTDGLAFHLDASNPASYPGTGTTWTDLVSSGNLTFAAQPGYRAAPGFVNFNSALAAGNQATGTFAGVSSITEGALEIWFRWKTTQAAASGTLMTTVDGAGNWVHLGQASSGEAFEFFNNAPAGVNYLAMDYMNAAGATYLKDNEWHQIVVVVTGGGALDPTTIYLDGALVPPIVGGTGVQYRHGSNASEVLWNAAGVTLGRLAPSSQKYTSDIAIIRMYERDYIGATSFSAAEVAQNYSVDGPKFQTFYPDTIGKLTLWLDPDDASTVTMSGLNVSVLADKAFAVPAAQAAGVTGPTIESVGGRNWMKFNGTTQSLPLVHSGASILEMHDISTGKQAEVHVVMRADGATGSSASAYQNDQAFGGSSGYWGLYAKQGAAPVDVVIQSQQYPTPSAGIDYNAATSGAPAVGVKHILGQSFNGATFHAYLDGVADSVGGTASGGMTYTTSQIRLGNGGTYGAYYDGLIGEVLVFNETLTVSERNDVIDYLRAKWGTP